jgi:hypothetical protein
LPVVPASGEKLEEEPFIQKEDQEQETRERSSIRWKGGGGAAGRDKKRSNGSDGRIMCVYVVCSDGTEIAGNF